MLFAQAVTVVLAAAFTIAVLRPEWMPARLSAPARPSTGAGTSTHADTPSGPATAVPIRPGAGAPTAGAPPSQVAPAALDARVLSYADAAQRAIPSVVNIVASKRPEGNGRARLLEDPLLRRFFGERDPERDGGSSLGSGVILGADGLVLTNHHVIERADDIEILLADGRRLEARVIGSDPETDLAVLRAAQPGLPAITIGDADALRVGDVVLAIGNPFGVGQTVTMGIVSALGRDQLGINTFENFIQTDAAINPGNSGGALVDTQGRLLGINTAIYSRSGGSLGIGFAIPASTVQQVLTQIVASGRVIRGFIGVEPQDLTPEVVKAFDLAVGHGALIAGVMRDGPADRAGMRVGDVLVAVEGKPVRNVPSMLNLVAQLSPGSTARFQVVRDGREIEIAIAIDRRPNPGALGGR